MYIIYNYILAYLRTHSCSIPFICVYKCQYVYTIDTWLYVKVRTCMCVNAYIIICMHVLMCMDIYVYMRSSIMCLYNYIHVVHSIYTLLFLLPTYTRAVGVREGPQCSPVIFNLRVSD